MVPRHAVRSTKLEAKFDKDTQLEILKKFAPLLHGDGLLFAGHSENFYHADAWFKLRGHTVYELAARLKAARM